MLWNSARETVLHDLLVEAREDIVGVWLVLGWIRDAFPQLDDDAARDATLDVIERALKSSDVVGGSFVEAGESSKAFETWQLDSHSAVARIERVWRALGRDPDIGDNLWLAGKDLHYVPR